MKPEDHHPTQTEFEQLGQTVCPLWGDTSKFCASWEPAVSKPATTQKTDNHVNVAPSLS